ncbi:MAG: YceI family protein [Ginsengibacter sp.]
MSQTKWTIDAVHSEINFKVKHLMISTVTGKFNNFSLTVETENDDFNTAKNIRFTADVDSIDTANEQRNAHLRSADFFNAELHPQIIFSGTKYDANDDEGILSGDLNIGGITKPITLKVEFGGSAKDPWGGERAGFTVSGKVSRKEFGLTYNAVTEAGGVVVGDEIKINAEVQLVKQTGVEVEKEELAEEVQ